MTDSLLDIPGLAERLKVKESWVRDKVKARAIPFTRVGRHVRFTPDHVERIIAAGETPVVAAPPQLAVLRRGHPPSGPGNPPPPPGPKKARTAA